ncbi:hypothetical protein AB0B50_40005 [Streptomyces sp. NPDC041068]|uniref:hypothetical protein n=1 Tax=Streptomyces sp. NPDC041068 TaxID=3155130 RepID=UPI00340472E8
MNQKKWVEAGDLKPGTALRTDDGRTVKVMAARQYRDHARTYNLTIEGRHELPRQRRPEYPDPERSNGDVLRFNPRTNEFGVKDPSGVPRTYFKPDPTSHGYPTNLDYFNAR